MAGEPELLAVGPWQPEQVDTAWHEEIWKPSEELARRADEEIEKLRDRGSPTHDGLAARLSGYAGEPDRLALELQPVRWALRLIDAPDARSLTALCVVRSEDGRWLAGRRASWLATWANRWALGAGGSVEVGEDPVETLARELDEEWRLAPVELAVEALVLLPSGLVALLGLATVPSGSEPVPDAEHDEFTWWPADVASWPEHVDERLRRMAAFIAARSSSRA
jgi:ADP-ribose pyrophosphatase YjhB (NUDIX family)